MGYFKPKWTDFRRVWTIFRTNLNRLSFVRMLNIYIFVIYLQ